MSGVTLAPGKTRMRTTVASVCAGMSWMLSSRGTRVPVDPRTWRIIGPRFTVSVQMAERSTGGAAGLSRATITTAIAMTTTATPAYTNIWRFFFCLSLGGRYPCQPGGSTCHAKRRLQRVLKNKELNCDKSASVIRARIDRLQGRLFDIGQFQWHVKAGWMMAQTRSTARATALPPPRQSAAIPRSCRSAAWHGAA